MSRSDPTCTGVLLIDKPTGKTSFTLVRQLRRLTREQCVGHAGTLDPFATGVMVMLIGRTYTRLSSQFLNQDKEYLATIYLGTATDTYDCDGQILSTSDFIPSMDEITSALQAFQGWISQLPPMFSAKKVGGKKLYELARKGKEVERTPIKVHLQTELLSYNYPHLELRIACSKGTYVRSVADDLGKALGCFGHLSALKRSRSGPFTLQQCLDGQLLDAAQLDIRPHLIRQII